MRNETTMKIPKKYEPMIEEIYHDSDGYWAYSEPGYYFPPMDCHTAHEDTRAELLAVIRTVASCDCNGCNEWRKEHEEATEEA